ncbi:MAG: TIGR00153 family protein [Desulfobacterales bacterium]|nr:TIGR00153 family protein [Desulfobacterales bacterium]
MRIPFLSMFMNSPFEGLKEHAEKVKESAWSFKKAIECYVSKECNMFEEFRLEIVKLEDEADKIKRKIRSHLPKGAILPVDKVHLFRYLREQDNVLDSVKEALEWISFRTDPGLPDELLEEFLALTEAVIKPIEKLDIMLDEARKYFYNYGEQQRQVVKDIIRSIRELEREADKIEYRLKQKIFTLKIDPIGIFHLILVVTTMDSIADHAENAADMIRAMLAR